MKLADTIKYLRTVRGESQAKLASQLGVSQSAVAKWELGRSEPSAGAIVKMCRHFHKSADYLLGLRESEF